jgi:hypothetical protein
MLRATISLLALLACAGCGAGRMDNVSTARNLARYENARDSLRAEAISEYSSRYFCWTRTGAECNEETLPATDAGKALSACIGRLAAIGDRPAPDIARRRLESCMNDLGWHRQAFDEITIAL